jgi:hypothetical protein
MRYLITGVDQSGRSCVVDEITVPGSSDSAQILHTESSPPVLSPPRSASFLDLGVQPGCIRWSVLTFEPGREYAMHETDTVDLDTVLAGTIDLVLDAAVERLTAGDGAVINGISHGWRVTSEGCTLSVANLGSVSRRSPPTGS